jgi:hypothetical protein
MDQLDRIASAADHLLSRLDSSIEHRGAPAGHPVWDGLRRVRLLPADAVSTVVALRPEPVDDAVPALRSAAESVADVAATLPGPGVWAGTAADAYDDQRRGIARSLDDATGLAARVRAAAAFGAELSRWMRAARGSLAAALADALTSAEAVRVLGGDDPSGAAAADLAAHVLDAVSAAYRDVPRLLDRAAAVTDAAA